MSVHDELRRLSKQVAGLQQKVDRVVVAGVVKEAKGDRVVLDIGQDGNEMLSPNVRLGTSSGAAGGGHSVYTKPGVGEPMLLVSPGGVIGRHSRAMPFGPVDDHPSPGTAENDGHVHVVGNSRFTVKDKAIEQHVGAHHVSMSTDGGIALNAPGKPVEIGEETDNFHVKTPSRFEKPVAMGAGGTVKGDLTIIGDLRIVGNLDVQGTITCDHLNERG